MNSLATFQTQIGDEIAAVEKEIQSHNQQRVALTERLKSLKRAEELLQSDQAAVAELLQTGDGDERDIFRQIATVSAPARRRPASPQPAGTHKQLGVVLGLTVPTRTPRAPIQPVAT